MSLGQIKNVPSVEPRSRKERAAEHDRRHFRLANTAPSFASFLARTESRAVGSADKNCHTPLVQKEELVGLLRDVQTEMDLRLLDSLIAREEDREALTGAFESFATVTKGLAAINGASKYRQEAPKYDAMSSPGELAPIIRQASEKYGVDQDLIRAVIKAESNFRPQSTSPKGAMGLMQLMPETAQEVGVKDPYNPVENIMGGTRYLKGLLNRYQGNIPLALAAYNWGAGNMEKYPDRLPRETRDYIMRVTREYQSAKV
jgi:hypothetical protein